MWGKSHHHHRLKKHTKKTVFCCVLSYWSRILHTLGQQLLLILFVIRYVSPNKAIVFMLFVIRCVSPTNAIVFMLFVIRCVSPDGHVLPEECHLSPGFLYSTCHPPHLCWIPPQFVLSVNRSVWPDRYNARMAPPASRFISPSAPVLNTTAVCVVCQQKCVTWQV